MFHVKPFKRITQYDTQTIGERRWSRYNASNVKEKEA